MSSACFFEYENFAGALQTANLRLAVSFERNQLQYLSLI